MPASQALMFMEDPSRTPNRRWDSEASVTGFGYLVRSIYAVAAIRVVVKIKVPVWGPQIVGALS